MKVQFLDGSIREFATTAEACEAIKDQARKAGKARARLTKDQKKAIANYDACLRQEDRYLGSVFVTPQGQRDVEAKTHAAYEEAKRLGVNNYC